MSSSIYLLSRVFVFEWRIETIRFHLSIKRTVTIQFDSNIKLILKTQTKLIDLHTKMICISFFVLLFFSILSFPIYVRTHQQSSNSDSFICKYCDKSFVVKLYYEQHMKTHDELKNKSEPSENMMSLDENPTENHQTVSKHYS